MIECALNYTSIYVRKQVKLDGELWYEHVPKSLETSQEGKVTILWNQQVQTNRNIPNNKLALIIQYNEE
jgi:hypothetical protein